MAKVEKFNGEGGTTEGMYFYQFAGRPIDQYSWPSGDPSASKGDVFVLTVRAEVVKVVDDLVKDGPRQTIGFKVVDAKLGSMVARSDGADPNQTSIDDIGDRDSGEYGDYTPPQYDPDAHEGYPPEADEDTDTDADAAHNNPFTVV